VEHKAVNESFNNGALSFQEFSLLISSGSVGNHNLDFGLGNSDVIFEASIIYLNNNYFNNFKNIKILLKSSVIPLCVK
jgi:hypothetical protein